MLARVDEFVAKLGKLHASLETLTQTLKRLDAILGAALEASMVTKTLNDIVTMLYDVLEAAHAAATALGAVPYVNVVAKPVAQVLGRIKDQVRTFQEQLERLEKKIQPLRDKLRDARARLAKLLDPIARLNAFVSHELERVEGAQASLAALPESRYRHAQQAELERLAGALAGTLDGPIRTVARVQGSLEALRPTLDAVEGESEELLRSVKQLTSLVGDLENVRDDAEAVDEALNVKIPLGGVPITIRNALKIVDKLPNPVMDLIKKALGQAMQQLKRGTGLRLPGPLEIIASVGAVCAQLGTVKAALDKAIGELGELGDEGKLSKTFDKAAA